MSSVFPTIYENVTCPLEGYEGVTVRVLANPLGSTINDWVYGHLGVPFCPDCEATTGDRATTVYCPSCQQARERFGRALSAAYAESRAPGLDFSTPEAALATIDGDNVPDEFVAWLLSFAPALWKERKDTIKKKLPGFSTSGN